MMNSEIKRIANSYAEEFCSDAIYPSHLFKAVLHKDMGLVHFLETELDKDYFYLQDWADIQMQLSPRATRPSSDLELSDEGQAVMDEAFSYQEKFGMSSCEPICVLASLVTPGVGFTFDQLKTLPLNATEICNKIGIKTSADGTVVASATTPTAKSVTGKGVVQQYCINKIEEVQAGKIAPVVGFENEISTIFEILGRKTKSNLLITGESGVGKTSLINGFATQLAQGRMPSFLNNAKLYELDLAALSADASYKGEIEDRFKKVLAEIRETENAILVIESIDKLFDKQGSLYGAATMLKQELGKGNLLLLCTSSIDGYTKNIETDKEFVTKLEKISLEEPNADLCLRILKGALPTYENFHHLSIAEPVMADAIRLAKRYLTEKALPDSAFDLIDHTMALLKTMNDMSATDLASMEEKLNSLQSADPKMTEEEQMKELEWLNYEMLHKTSCILLAQLDTDTDFSKLPTVEKRVSYLQKSLQQLAGLAAEKRTSVESADLYAVVAKQTGIPLGKVQSKERDRLVNAEGTLKKRVVGQDHAVKIVLDAVFESRSGLNKKGQPMGSFFFLGPTGTGKTELSKALAAFLFEDESALIRFDMSEFKEEHSVALLYGAPPGYVGYEEGGLLVNKIRQKPYSVVLFDEIEKAHKSVFDLFLQILDEGKLHDRLGRVGDFSNALILFTSNIGSQFIVDSFNQGKIPQNNDLMDIMQNYFRPEFLGRLTEIVPFSPITEKTVTRIFEIHLKGLLKLLAEQEITLQMDDEVKRTIAMKGYNPQYGARPVLGIIRKELRHPLSKLIISGQVKSGDTVVVKVSEEGQILFETEKKS
ncbi:MAG: ATP-dependent Clp protease ATP-binding subunit [bacterium]|nr:ATP-dependent Clp protease ATP-binding subunit [Parabacteroides sp.]MDD6100110.1 ATP-dependent Clp protease ATP-binding subunit [bacterium]MDD6748370.1 ATP-dependent Clp protease ATP-binding subunit [bacterium]MDD6835627.1 ATP-dependent Clp protease ATP-binding subunit [bacterium]MDD7722753.1 ATP-dependent Clp protease ATP-binding subunit [bacterium]